MKKTVTVLAFLLLLTPARAAGDSLSIARLALEDGLYKVAQEQAEQALPTLTPATAEAAEALKILLSALDGLHRYPAMLAAIEAHAGIIQSHPETVFTFRRAQALYETGQYEKAIAAAAIPNDVFGEWAVAVRRVAARAWLALKRPQEALALFELIDTSSTEPATRAENALEWSYPLEAQGQIEKAIVCLDPFAVQMGDGDAFARCALRQAALFAARRQTESAVLLLRKMGGDPRVSQLLRVEALVTLSELADSLGDAKLALTAARDAYAFATLARAQRLAGVRLSLLLLKAPETVQEGIDLLKTVIRLNPSDPDSPRMQLLLANALLENGQAEAALAEYRIYAEAYENHALAAEALAGRARALTQLKRYAEALPLFTQAIELSKDPRQRRLLMEAQAETAHAGGNYTRAAEVYRQLIDTAQDDDGRLSLMLADTYERMGHNDEALEQFRKTIRQFSTGSFSAAAALRLGALLTDMNRLNDAIDVYTRIIKETTDPTLSASAHLGRGRTYYRAFRFDAASADLRQAATLGTPATQEEARFFLVLSLYGLGRDAEARATAESYLEKYPESARTPDVILWLGKSDFNHGNYEQARTLFTDFITRWPENPWADAALLWAARAAFQSKDFPGVVELAARLVREYPRSGRIAEARFVQAEALIEMARFNDALALLDEIHTRYPDSEWATEAWGRKGDCLSMTGVDNPARYGQAIDAYREMIARLASNPELRIQYQYKIGRALEKQKRTEEAIDQYYKEVVARFLTDRRSNVWYGENGRTWFLKGAYQLSDLLVKNGRHDQAVAVLRRILDARIGGDEEVKTWLKRLER